MLTFAQFIVEADRSNAEEQAYFKQHFGNRSKSYRAHEIAAHYPVLYPGTSREAAEKIKDSGLKPSVGKHTAYSNDELSDRDFFGDGHKMVYVSHLISPLPSGMRVRAVLF